MRPSILPVLVTVLALWSVGADAQQAPDRAQTIEAVISRVAQIQADAAAAYQPLVSGGSITSEALKPVLERSLKMAVDLRDELASNPHVRISSIGVGFPGGITIGLTFAEQEK